MQLIDEQIDLSAYLDEPNPGEKVIPASSVYERVRDEFLMPAEMSGARTPWAKADAMIRFRKSEVSLWPGLNNSGKSVLTSQVALNLCQQDERVCIASLEMPSWKTMKRMTRQAAGGPEPAGRYIRAFHEWTDDRLWLFDHVGTINPERLTAVMRYCADKLGITQFFVDSLMRCVKGEDDYNGQKDFVVGLCDVAQQTGLHVHLIHHNKKPLDESHKPTRFDARGASGITDNVDNVYAVWRNKPKEREMQFAAKLTEAEREELEDQPDALLICDKQRDGGWEGRLGLWYDPPSLTYRADRRAPFTRGMELALSAEAA
jgi:twinkle protein